MFIIKYEEISVRQNVFENIINYVTLHLNERIKG